MVVNVCTVAVYVHEKQMNLQVVQTTTDNGVT